MRAQGLRAAVIVLSAAALAGYVCVGALLDVLPVGLDPSAFVAGEAIQAAARIAVPGVSRSVAGLFWLLFALSAIALAAFLALRVGARRAAARPDVGRRGLLACTGAALGVALASAVVAFGAGFARAFLGLSRSGRGWGPVALRIFAEPVPETHPEWPEAWRGSRVRAHRRFGRTGFSVSDIVLGSSRISGEAGERVVREALERGVNYIDTAPDYAASGSEQAIGRAIRGARERIFLATKFCTPLGHLPAGTPVREYVRAVEASLVRLRTDYVDLCHVHSCNSIARLLDQNLHEAFDRLREAGKVRFLGFSSHTPELERVAEAAIASGRFDVMMLAYHHGIWPRLSEIISRARAAQDMGIVAMKTLKGAAHRGLAGSREQAGAYSQAALAWTLSNPDVSCAVISFYEPQHLDEYLRASGRALAPQDTGLLEGYDRATRGRYCAPHCGACLDRCPEGVAIPDVLRYRMYAEDYRWPAEGERLYARLHRDATACLSCEAPCLGSCPLGIPIRERMLGAHALLARGRPALGVG